MRKNIGSGGSSYRADVISVVAKTDVPCYPLPLYPQDRVPLSNRPTTTHTSSRANWYLRPLYLEKNLPTTCKLSNPLFLPTMMSAEWYPRQTMAANKHVFSLSSRPTSLSSAVNYRGGMRYRWWLPARLVELQRSSDIGGLFA